MEKRDGTDNVRFYNVSLVNANVMSIPRFPQPQRLIGELVRSVEAASPRFAWVQFLFRRVNYSPTLVALKNAMHYAAEQIKTPGGAGSMTASTTGQSSTGTGTRGRRSESRESTPSPTCRMSSLPYRGCGSATQECSPHFPSRTVT